MKILLLLIFISFSYTSFGVYVIYEKKKKKKKPWKVRIEVSYVNTSGNIETQTLSAKSNAKWEGKKNRFFMKGSAFYAKQEDKETANKFSIEVRAERLLTEKFFIFTVGGYERDRFSGYLYKWNTGYGVGYDFIKTKKQKLKGLVSLHYYYNKVEDGSIDNYATFRAEFTYSRKLTKNLTFKQFANYIVDTQDTRVYFLNSETSLEINVTKKIALGISYKLAYQNVPPEEGIERLDTIFSTSLIANF